MTYTELEKWFDAVTAAVGHSVPGIFDDVDLTKAHEQLRAIADAPPDRIDNDGPLLLQVKSLIDELGGAVHLAASTPAADTDAERWLGYVINRLKTIVETNAERTEDP